MIRTNVIVSSTIAVVLLGACDTQPTSSTAIRQQTVRDSAEQVMYNARMLITSNGVRRGEVSGDWVFALDEATRFDFRPIQAQFSTPLGRPLAVLGAIGGEYSLVDGTLRTRGTVTITSDTARRRIDARVVRYDPVQNQLASDSVFTATAGSRKLTGVGFTADPGLFRIKCLQRCTGSLGP